MVPKFNEGRINSKNASNLKIHWHGPHKRELKLSSFWVTFMGSWVSLFRIHVLRATSQTRLRTQNHYISSTFIGGKGGAAPSSLPTTLEGPMEYVNERPWHSSRSQQLIYFILSCVKIPMNRNSLKENLVEGPVTYDFTLHYSPWPHCMILEVSWDGLWTLSFRLSQCHGHGSWLVCETCGLGFRVHGTLKSLTAINLLYFITCVDPIEQKFIEIAFGWVPGEMWPHPTIKGMWPCYMILEVSCNGLWTLSFGLSQFHGHGSSLMCKVAPNLSPTASISTCLCITSDLTIKLGPVHIGFQVPSHLRPICVISTVESMEVGTDHFTQVPKS